MKSGYTSIIGRPNAGKSTLLNRVLNSEISIVTPKAQTTREKVLGILTEPKGQIVFIDTPGIHRAKEGGINSYMMAEAQAALDAPDCVWYIVDPKSGIEFEAPVLELLVKVKVPVLVIINKMDLKIPGTQQFTLDNFVSALMNALKEREIDVKEVFKLSALKDPAESLTPLLEATWSLLPEGPAFYPDDQQLSDRPVRFFVAEKIREQLLLHLGEELPYSCAVLIEKFEENLALPRIEAVIYVERDSQKGMVIGAGGKKIKAIGMAARTGIESFVGNKVFLGLQVKVLKDWSRDTQALKQLGYNIAEPKKRSGNRSSS